MATHVQSQTRSPATIQPWAGPDATLNGLLAECLAQPGRRFPLAITADYLEEQSDPRSTLLRDYTKLWTLGEELQIEGLKPRRKLDLSSLQDDARRLRWFACLCIRLMPLANGRRAWELLETNRSQVTVRMAELYNAELVVAGRLQSARLTDVEARGRWTNLAARHAAWTSASPKMAVQAASLAAECMKLAVSALPAPSQVDRRTLTGWQQALLAMIATAGR